MSDPWSDLLAARARVAASDQKLQATAGALKHRLAPATIAAEGRRTLRAKGLDAAAGARAASARAMEVAADNPTRVAIVAAALVAFLARHRIAAAITRSSASRPEQERSPRGRSRS